MTVVSFNQIPGNLRVPFMRFEVNAGESPYESNQRLLIVGQVLPGVTVPVQPVLVDQNADGLFGDGSQLSAMYNAARQAAPFQEIWCLPLADASTGSPTKASGTITVGTSAFPLSAPGSCVVYIGGIRISVAVSTTMANTDLAADLVDAINICPDMQVTATQGTAGSANVVTVTANNAGTLGNTVRIETRLAQDDGSLADAVLTIVQPVGGTGDPVFTAAIASLGDEQWDWIVMPYCTTSALDTWKTFLTSRWGPMEQKYGFLVSAMDGTLGTVQAFTSARNNQYESIFATYTSPQPTYINAAVYGALMAVHLQSPPELSRPLQTLVMPGIRAPKQLANRFDVTARQTLYYNGASGYTVDRDGTVRIDRAISTYQANSNGQPDQAWLDVNTLAQVTYGIRYIWQYMTDKYPRCALVDSNPNNIQNFVTVEDLKNGFIHAYQDLVALGVFENADVFARLLQVERNQSDPNRVDTYLPLDSVNQLRILAVNATSYLQFPTSSDVSGAPTISIVS